MNTISIQNILESIEEAHDLWDNSLMFEKIVYFENSINNTIKEIEFDYITLE